MTYDNDDVVFTNIQAIYKLNINTIIFLFDSEMYRIQHDVIERKYCARNILENVPIKIFFKHISYQYQWWYN